MDLKINDLRLWVHLGCSEQEKYSPQAVRIDIEFLFQKEILAIKSDNLHDTICYVQVTELLQSLVEEKSFNLIEYLTYCMFETIEEKLLLPNHFDIHWKITVTKLSPPVANVHGGVSFSYEK